MANYPYSLPPKHNLFAQRAPTTTDDITYGFEVGSLWLDRTNDGLYFLEANEENAANWLQLTEGQHNEDPDAHPGHEADPTAHDGLFTAVDLTYTPSGTTTVDCSLGSYFYTIANVDDTTWAFTNTRPAGIVTSVELELVNGGDFNQLWPANIDWDEGVAPVLTASGRDLLSFATRDAGAQWYGKLIAKDLK